MMNKVVLVTGGSRGLGAAICRLAATKGYDVAVHYRSKADEAESVAEAVRSQGQRAIILQGDVADPAIVPQLFDKTEADLGKVTSFISNAGIINRAAPLADLTYEQIREIIDVDLTSHIWACGEAVRRMSTKRGGLGGSIVIMSSAASRLAGAGGFIPYGAAKAGTDALALGLAREVGAEGIRVNAVRPGLIDTDIQDDTGIPNRVANLGGSVPMARGGTADEVADAVIWLMSEQAGYVTAALLDVTGGR